MAQDFFENRETVICPKCDHENEHDPENDTLICESCDALLSINDDGSVSII